MKNTLYSFIFKGELAKVSLKNVGLLDSTGSVDISKRITERLSIELLDENMVADAKNMAVVYTAIAAFENTVRELVSKILAENMGADWWNSCVSDTIRKKAESRYHEEQKIKWHTQRGDSLINYIDFSELISIIQFPTNWPKFEGYFISQDWIRQIFSTLERSRNVIMHSGQLSMQDVERIGTYIRDWVNQVGS